MGHTRTPPQQRAKIVTLHPGARTLTVGQVAAFTDVANRTVVRWIDEKRLPGHRIPDSLDRRVYIDDLVKFLRARGLRVPPDLMPPTGIAYGLLPGETVPGFTTVSAFEVGEVLAASNVVAAVIGDCDGREMALACARMVRGRGARVVCVAGEDTASRIPRDHFDAVLTRPVDLAAVAKVAMANPEEL